MWSTVVFFSLEFHHITKKRIGCSHYAFSSSGTTTATYRANIGYKSKRMCCILGIVYNSSIITRAPFLYQVMGSSHTHTNTNAHMHTHTHRKQTHTIHTLPIHLNWLGDNLGLCLSGRPSHADNTSSTHPLGCERTIAPRHMLFYKNHTPEYTHTHTCCATLDTILNTMTYICSSPPPPKTKRDAPQRLFVRQLYVLSVLTWDMWLRCPAVRRTGVKMHWLEGPRTSGCESALISAEWRGTWSDESSAGYIDSSNTSQIVV